MRHISEFGVQGLGDFGKDETAEARDAIYTCLLNRETLDWSGVGKVLISRSLDTLGLDGVAYDWQGNPHILADVDGTYNEVLEADGSASGKKVILDIAGTHHNSLRGHTIVETTSPVGNWRKASRAIWDGPVGDLAALTASKNMAFDGQESYYENFEGKKLAAVLYQSDHSSGNARKTPFTGSRFGSLSATICERIIWTGSKGRVDDVVADSVRQERCGNGSSWYEAGLSLKAAQMKVNGTLFIKGMVDKDLENVTLTAVAGQDTMQINGGFSFAINDWIAVGRAGGNPGVANQIIEDLGNGIWRCRYTWPHDITDTRFWWEPPVGFNLDTSSLTVGCFYPEGAFLTPGLVRSGGKFVALDTHGNLDAALRGAMVTTAEYSGAVFMWGGPVQNDLQSMVAMWRCKGNTGDPAARNISVCRHDAEADYAGVDVVDEDPLPSDLATSTSVYASPADWAVTKDNVKINGDPVDLQA